MTMRASSVDWPLVDRRRCCCRCTASRSSTRPARPTCHTARRDAWTRRRSSGSASRIVVCVHRQPLHRSACIDWLTMPVYALTIAAARRLLAVRRQGRRHGREHEELAGDRRHPHRPAVGAREDHGRARCWRSVLARSRSRRSRCSSCGSPRSSSACRGLLIMLQPDLGTGIVFIGIFFAMLFWAGVSWPLLRARREPGGEPHPRVQRVRLGRVVPPAHRARALVRAVSGRRDRARRRECRDGRARADHLGQLAPYQQKRLLVFLDPTVDPRAARLPRHAVAGRDRLGRLVRQGLHAGHAEAPRVPSGAAHRFHLRGRRRGARLHRRDAGVVAVPAAVPPRDEIAERANDSFSSLVAFGLLASWFVHVLDERRHDAEPDADHRHSAAVLQLRRLVHAGELAGRSASSSRISSEGRGGGRAAERASRSGISNGSPAARGARQVAPLPTRSATSVTFRAWPGSGKRRSRGSRGGSGSRSRRMPGRSARPAGTRTSARSSSGISTSARTATITAASAPTSTVSILLDEGTIEETRSISGRPIRSAFRSIRRA